jgi:predicted MFS family arabinose efflux permease
MSLATTFTSPTSARRTLSSRMAYVLVALIISLALFASSTPSPLYGTYRELWGFSSFVLTLVYATYAFGVLGALLLAGRISDEVGRRPVLLMALVALMGTTFVFMAADSVWWLFVARGAQGVATGMALGAASAALLDLHPGRSTAGVALTNAVVSTIGMGLGTLVSGAFVEWLPAPRVLPYVALLVLFAIAFAGALLMPEPVQSRSRLRLTPQRPSVPPAVRRPFLLASLGVYSSWSIGGLFLSLGPQLSAMLFHSSNHIINGLPFMVLAGAGALAQLTLGRSAPWLGASAGSVALAGGMALIVAGVGLESAVLYLLGAAVGGAGFGVAFLGGLRTLSAAIPARHRAEVMSAFYVVAYSSLSLPAVTAGLLVTPLGVRTTFEIFGSLIGALALVVAFEAWRTRPPIEPAEAVIISS